MAFKFLKLSMLGKLVTDHQPVLDRRPVYFKKEQAEACADRGWQR